MFGKRYRQFSTLRQVESCIPGNEAEAVLSLETGKSPAYLVRVQGNSQAEEAIVNFQAGEVLILR